MSYLDRKEIETKRELDKYDFFLYTVFAVIIVIGLSVFIWMIHVMNHTYTESHDKIVTIVDKDKESYRRLRSVRPIMYITETNYYIITDEDVEMEVSEGTYNSLKIGDKIIISVTEYYDKDTNRLKKTSQSIKN